MQSVVTDPSNDYIFASDFDRLSEHVSRSVAVACRVEPHSITALPLPMCDPHLDLTQSSSGTKFTTVNIQITTTVTSLGT